MRRELIWRERDTHFDGIHDALPMRETTDWLSQVHRRSPSSSSCCSPSPCSCGIIMQTIAGYYHYELLQYFKELYLVTFPQVLGFTLFALFVQTVVSQQVRGPRDRDRRLRAACRSCSASAGRTRCYLPGADPAVHLLAT